jgi:CRP-like cAMP-binding protein
MLTGTLGKLYQDGEIIIREGDTGDCMYVIQSGRVEVMERRHDKEFCLAVLEKGDVFGEMALFDNEPRSATVRALGEVWVLTLPRRAFFKRVREDPSLAFRMLQRMSQRIRDLDSKLVAEADTDFDKISGR